MANTVLIFPILKTYSKGFVNHLNQIDMLGYPLKASQYRDPPYKGNSKIIGTVRVVGVLSNRRVTLLERSTLVHLQTTQSDTITGEFEFIGLAADKNYIVIADDHERIYNAVIADWVKVDD